MALFPSIQDITLWNTVTVSLYPQKYDIILKHDASLSSLFDYWGANDVGCYLYVSLHIL